MTGPQRVSSFRNAAPARCYQHLASPNPDTGVRPDAELITHCAETTRLRGAMNAVVDAMMGLSFPEAEKLQPDLDRTTIAYSDAVELAATIPATSPAGVRAKAAVLRESIEEFVGICGGEVMGDTEHKLAGSLARDLAAVPVMGDIISIRTGKPIGGGIEGW
jgi:hypothetical protein